MRKEAKLQDTQNPDIWAWATRFASFLLLLELLAEADLSFGWGGLLGRDLLESVLREHFEALAMRDPKLGRSWRRSS